MPGFLDSAMDALRRARTPQDELRKQLGPLTEAGMPMLPGGLPGALRGTLGQSVQDMLNPGAERAISAMSRQAKPIYEGLKAAGKFAGDRTTGGLHKLSGGSRQAAETLGEVSPEFTPVGGEGFYNVAKSGLSKGADAAEKAYSRILGRGGR